MKPRQDRTPASKAHALRGTALTLALGLTATLWLVTATPTAQASAGASPTAKMPTPTPAELRQRLAQMPQGDAERGRQLYSQNFCASCHGGEGTAPTLNWPHLAGQREAYSYKLLQDYQLGVRHEGERAALMRDAVMGLSAQQLADLAAYTARLTGPVLATAPPSAVDKPTPVVEQLVRHGDPRRLLTPCASCHGVRGEGGTKAQPALAGQNPAYLVRTLLDYHGGARANDPARGMRAFATKLTREEVDALALYYARLPGRR